MLCGKCVGAHLSVAVIASYAKAVTLVLVLNLNLHRRMPNATKARATKCTTRKRQIEILAFSYKLWLDFIFQLI